MNSKEIRNKFLKFFEDKNHEIVESSSLIPEDESVLFTTAGMQQFKDYYLGKESPWGLNVTTAQKCFRTSDIEEVGDKDHLTFLEMLGNFSFGGYFKKEAIEWALQFLTEEMKIDEDRLVFTVFKGEEGVPKDKRSEEIWRNLGASEDQIKYLGMEDNFWGPTGNSGPCGPTTEIHYDLTGEPCGKDCHLDCECGRYVEIWNLVFNEFYMDEDGELEKLDQKGIDTGMGLERLAMVVQEEPHVFKTDLFSSLKEELEKSGKPEDRSERIIADHLKGATFLISEGVRPSKTERGYILRRLLRRAMRYQKLEELPFESFERVVKSVFEIYGDSYLESTDPESVLEVIEEEKDKFEEALSRGMKEFEKRVKDGKLDGETAFHIYSTYGFPVEMIEEICKERGIEFEKDGFEKAKEKHKEASRQNVEEKFGGLSKDPEKEEKKLHTATHLLHNSLREVLGDHVIQKGSDINPERLRFDFSHSEKLSDKELREIEDMVNQWIEKDLKMKVEEMSYDEAIEEGALAPFDKERYPEKVKVYKLVNPETGKEVSKELCGGPHVEDTSEMGKFEITKEESSGRGVRRIKAILK